MNIRNTETEISRHRPHRGSDMKSLYLALATVLLPLLLFSCLDHDAPRFEVIENFKLRLVGSKLEGGPNITPGDTVRVKLYFAGDSVLSVGGWKVLNGPVFTHMDGKTIRRTDYDTLTVRELHSWLPDSVEVELILDSAVIANNPKYLWVSEGQLAKLDTIRKKNSASSGAYVANMSQAERDTLQRYLENAHLAVHIFGNATSSKGTTLEIKKELAVTYRKEFPTIIPPHKNAECNWIAVYGIPSSTENSFQPHSSAYLQTIQRNYLYHRNHPESVSTQIPIRSDWSYYLAADADIDAVKESEHKQFNWFIENLDKVYDKPESLMVLDDEDDEFLTAWSDVVQFTPPQKREMKRFKVWVNVNYRSHYLQSQVMQCGEGSFIYE